MKKVAEIGHIDLSEYHLDVASAPVSKKNAELYQMCIRDRYLTYLDGTVFKQKDLSAISEDYIMLPSFEDISHDKKAYAKSFGIQYRNTDHYNAKTLVEPYEGFYVVQNRPNRPLTQMEFDDTYALPYQRTYHPSYDYIPAIEEVDVYKRQR